MQLPAGFSSSGFSYGGYRPFPPSYLSDEISDPSEMPAAPQFPMMPPPPERVPASHYSDKLESSLTRHYHRVASYCAAAAAMEEQIEPAAASAGIDGVVGDCGGGGGGGGGDGGDHGHNRGDDVDCGDARRRNAPLVSGQVAERMLSLNSEQVEGEDEDEEGAQEVDGPSSGSGGNRLVEPEREVDFELQIALWRRWGRLGLN